MTLRPRQIIFLADIQANVVLRDHFPLGLNCPSPKIQPCGASKKDLSAAPTSVRERPIQKPWFAGAGWDQPFSRSRCPERLAGNPFMSLVQQPAKANSAGAPLD